MKKIIVTMLVTMFLFLGVVLLQAKTTVSTTAGGDNMKVTITKEIGDSEDAEDIAEAKEDAEDLKEDAEDAKEDAAETSDDAYMGLYTEDMSFADARRLNYNNNYGVLITGVVKNSPAQEYHLMKNDIIMELGGERVTDKDGFTSLVDMHNPSDKVQIKIFRNGTEKEIEFVFGNRSKPHTSVFVDGDASKGIEKEKKHISVGYGGGSWIPMYLTLNMDDINEMMDSLSFSEFNDNGMIVHGGGGKIGVGKGFFIGGMGAGYSYDRKTGVDVNVSGVNKHIIRRAQYSIGFGGATLDKRFGITKNLTLSTGFMIGGGSQSLKISQTDGNYTWSNLNTELEKPYNNYVELKKGYLVFQPRVEVMYHFLSWLALRAEGGYLLTYNPYKGWRSVNMEENYEVPTSPDTRMECYTISVGPWFGF